VCRSLIPSKRDAFSPLGYGMRSMPTTKIRKPIVLLRRHVLDLAQCPLELSPVAALSPLFQIFPRGQRRDFFGQGGRHELVDRDPFLTSELTRLAVQRLRQP
jgi:hypothetical protein